MTRTADRLRKIREIVSQEQVATQEDLVRALQRRGIRVTQATVSRDIKRLGLVKILDGGGQYRYALAEAAAETPPVNAAQRLRSAVEEYMTGVEVALDLVLVKTVRGGAPPVAQAIDDIRWPDVAGTLAGEDTIIVVPRTRASSRAVAQRLRALLAG